MARYSRDYQGIRGSRAGGSGRDPNYRGDEYRGMRTSGGEGQAPYGGYRRSHAGDFEGSGGFQGGPAGRARGYGRDYRPGSRRPPGYGHDYDARQGGGVRASRYDEEMLRDFNAESIRLRSEGRRRSAYGRDYEARQGERSAPGGVERQPRFDYGNRGIGSGGYSEGRAWGPMRGAR